MKVAIGSDHGGVRLKAQIVQFIESLGYEVNDVGSYGDESVDYPDFAEKVCQDVLQSERTKGILVCGTGIGMSIAANKIPGIRCALVHDTFSAKATREHNNTNVIALGERVVGPGLALEIVRTWLETPFSDEDRHANRINKITSLEQCYAVRP